MTSGEALRIGSTKLLAAGVDGAVRDARWLLAHALSIPRDSLATHLEQPMRLEAQRSFELAISARATGKPVSKIIQRREFYGREFEVTADVLDPRPETEGLIEHLLEDGCPKRILDLGTGSGVLAITAVLECTDASAMATDMSDAALTVARRNAQRLGADTRIEFKQSDWLSEIHESFDAVLCNPPYIRAGDVAVLAPEVVEWDPAGALFAGPDGLDAYRAIVHQLGSVLTKDGRAIFETGEGQTTDVAEILKQDEKFDVRILNEMSGRPRYVEAKHSKTA